MCVVPLRANYFPQRLPRQSFASHGFLCWRKKKRKKERKKPNRKKLSEFSFSSESREQVFFLLSTLQRNVNFWRRGQRRCRPRRRRAAVVCSSTSFSLFFLFLFLLRQNVFCFVFFYIPYIFVTATNISYIYISPAAWICCRCPLVFSHLAVHFIDMRMPHISCLFYHLWFVFVPPLLFCFLLVITFISWFYKLSHHF